MNRAQLEHLLRAAGAIAGVKDLIIIGSQAILGLTGEIPAGLLVSQEADVYPRDEPDKANLIDGTIGELSPFHDTFGYYAHGVGPETATLVAGWAERLIPISNENTGGVTGWCLDPSDLAISKLAAGRPKDIEYVELLLRSGIVNASRLLALAERLDTPGKDAVQMRLRRLAG